MKKLMIALSAVASAFALYADATTIASENFNEKTLEQLTGWSGLGDSSISSTAYTQHDANPAAGIPEQDKLALTLPGENLAVKTPLTAPAYLSFTETSMAGVYFDSLVKFTACDEDAAVVADAKIMVWTKEMTNASGDVTGTNLMVTAGFFGTGDALEPKVYDCGSITAYGVLGNGDDWCRLTIKAKNTVATSATVPAFVVFVNGKPATIAGIGDALKIGLDDSLILGALTKVDKIWEGNHQLFPSMVSMNDQISAIGFAGQGAVDDIEVYSGINPTLADGVTPFANDPVPVLATVNGDDCTSIEAVNAAIAAATSGATVELVDDVTGNLTFDNGAANTLNLGAFTLNGGITGGATSTLTINGTGKVEGTLYTDNTDAMVLLNGGQYLASANADIKDMAEAKAGYEIALNGDYYEITEISEDGTVAKPWKIGSVDDFAKLDVANQDAAHQNCVLKNDIDISGTTWEGIGDCSKTKGKAFKGVLDGQNYTIKGLTLKAGKYCGFFGQIDGGTVKNLTIEWAGFAEGATGEFGGGALAGYIYGNALIENVTIKNAEGVAKIPSGHNIAGFAVRAETGVTVKNCTNQTYIVAGETKAGGFVAITQNATAADYPATVTFDGCANLGTVEITSGKGGDGAAGFVGCANTSVKFTNGCVSTGTVTDLGTSAKAASLVGYFVVWSPSTSNFKVEIAEGTQVASSIKAIHTISPATGTTVADATYATVDDGVATFVKTLAADNTYKVMVNNSASTDTVALAKDDTVSFDETFFNFAGTVTPAEGCKITTATEGNVTTYTCAELVKAMAPTAVTGLTYTGAEQTGVATGDGYTLTDNTATDAGSYQATATLAEGYDCWSDDTTAAKTIDWSIAQATPTITTAPTASAEIEKDAALSTISLNGGVASTAGTFAWTTPATTVAESGEFDVTFTPTDAKNYTTATCKVAVTVKSGAQDWPADPSTVAGQTAGDAFGLEGELAAADAVKVATWAKAKEVAFGDKANIVVKAMLLNIANDGDVAAAEAAVKFTADDLAALMADPAAATSLATKYPYATVTIGAFADAACTEAYTTGDQKFFKATLTVPQASVE